MALEFVGSDGNSVTTGGSVTLTLPGGIAAGDVVYVAIGVGDNASNNFDMAMTTSGYAELAETTGVGTTGNANVACCHVWRGEDQATPEDATTQAAVRVGDSTAVNTPSIDTVTANAVVLSIGASSAGTLFTPTAPSGYGNLITENLNDSKAGNTVAIASKSVASPGTEDPGAWGSWSVGTSDCLAEATVAIRPATAAANLSQTKFRVFNDDGFIGPEP
jgi:hypothetical protein